MTQPKPALVCSLVCPLVCSPLPPLAAARPTTGRNSGGADLSRLGRLAACLVALALPVIGIAAADTVHRAAKPGTMQTAASGSPSEDAAVPGGASRAGSPVREALLLTSGREVRR